MCALVTGVQTCALPISAIAVPIDAHAIRIDEATPDEFIDATHHVIDHDIPPARALAGCAVVLVARTVGSDMRRARLVRLEHQVARGGPGLVAAHRMHPALSAFPRVRIDAPRITLSLPAVGRVQQLPFE